MTWSGWASSCGGVRRWVRRFLVFFLACIVISVLWEFTISFFICLRAPGGREIWNLDLEIFSSVVLHDRCCSGGYGGAVAEMGKGDVGDLGGITEGMVRGDVGDGERHVEWVFALYLWSCGWGCEIVREGRRVCVQVLR